MKGKRIILALLLFVFSVALLAATGNEALLPPNAKPGECYARTFAPPQFKNVTEKVTIRPASHRIEILPSQFEWVEEKVLVEQASFKLEVVPAKYKTVEEKVLVKPATKKIVEVPAVYKTVEEKVIDKPAHTVWKKGKGPIQKVNDATGEIMCLVNIPATYKTVTKKVLKTPATTKVVEIPAVYKTVTKKVVETPATTKKVQIPAKYKTVRVQKLKSPAKEKKIQIPAKYETVNKQVKTKEGKMSWKRILCETNMTEENIKSIQQALKNAGYNPGPIDGSLGPQMNTAIKEYQKKKNLAQAGLSMETIQSLGVKLGQS